MRTLDYQNLIINNQKNKTKKTMELFNEKLGFVTPNKSVQGNKSIKPNKISVIYRDKTNGKTSSYSICFGQWGNFGNFRYFTLAKKDDTLYFGFHNNPEMNYHALVSKEKNTKTITIYNKVVLDFLFDFLEMKDRNNFKGIMDVFRVKETDEVIIYGLKKKTKDIFSQNNLF